jgi:hypothetical protein
MCPIGCQLHADRSPLRVPDNGAQTENAEGRNHLGAAPRRFRLLERYPMVTPALVRVMVTLVLGPGSTSEKCTPTVSLKKDPLSSTMHTASSSSTRTTRGAGLPDLLRTLKVWGSQSRSESFIHGFAEHFVPFELCVSSMTASVRFVSNGHTLRG